MWEKRIWAVCLIVLGLAAVGVGLVRLLWAGVPDAVVRGLGITMLLALTVLAFVTVRLARKKK